MIILFIDVLIGSFMLIGSVIFRLIFVGKIDFSIYDELDFCF